MNDYNSVLAGIQCGLYDEALAGRRRHRGRTRDDIP